MRLIRELSAGGTIQMRTIRALLVRDMIMRYGRGNIGFAWVVLEPMILTVGVMFIWSTMGTRKEGIGIVELVLTGYMPLTLWRHLTGPVINMFRQNAPLLFHRRITLLDLVCARQILEIAATSAALVIVYVALLVTGFIEGLQKLDMILAGWLMMAWIGTAFGMLLAVTTELSETAERFVQPLQYLNIPVSGAFFLVDWLPPWAQTLILYHPLVHCYEVFRAGYFGDAIIAHYSIPYFLACAFAFSFAGLLAIQYVRSRIRLN